MHRDPFRFCSFVGEQLGGSGVLSCGLVWAKVSVDGIADHRMQKPRRTSGLEDSSSRERFGRHISNGRLEPREPLDEGWAGPVA
jgi:hypothetical protein